MKNEDFLDLLNEIDEKYIESASKRLEELHQYKDLEFGKALKPQVIRVERPEKRHIPFRRTAFGAVAAALVFAVTAGVFVKLNKPFSPNSGVTLSETSSKWEPISLESTVSEPVSSEPTIYEPTSREPTSREPTSSEQASREPTSYEPPFTDGKLRRLERDGYNFSLNNFVGNKNVLLSQPILKTDSENGIAICFACGRECEGRNFSIVFYLYDERNGTTKDRIATLSFTARGYTQWFTVPYKLGALKEGDKCVMELIPEDRNYTSEVVVKGNVLP